MPGFKVTTVSVELVKRTYHITAYTIQGAAAHVVKYAENLTVRRETMKILHGPLVETVRRGDVPNVLLYSAARQDILKVLAMKKQQGSIPDVCFECEYRSQCASDPQWPDYCPARGTRNEEEAISWREHIS